MESDYRKQINYVYKQVDSIFKREQNKGAFISNRII